jgi:type I restriction enzyme S subunit
MKEGYRLLGDFIRQVDVRNTDGKEENLLGVSVQKMFIPSIANTVGTDFTKYKVVKRGQFTYIPDTSRRGDKIGIALLTDYDEGLVSNIYTVFEVKDENELLPEYLMLWFSRPEFDRYARFKSHGSVREIMDWDEMCKVELPVPSIDKQRSIVKAYQTITERIELKRRINDNLAKTIKAVFKSWFLDFDAFDGVELVQSQYGLIPNGWHYELLGNLCDCVTKGTTPTTLGKDFTDTGINFIKGESINDDHSFNKTLFAHIDDETDELLKRSRIYVNDIVFTIAGTLGKFALVDSSVIPANTNQAVAIIRTSKIMPAMLYSYFIGEWQVEFYKRNTQQAVQANLSLGTIKDLPILLPDSKGQDHYMQLVTPLIVGMQNNFSEIERLYELQNQLLARLSASR